MNKSTPRYYAGAFFMRLDAVRIAARVRAYFYLRHALRAILSPFLFAWLRAARYAFIRHMPSNAFKRPRDAFCCLVVLSYYIAFRNDPRPIYARNRTYCTPCAGGFPAYRGAIRPRSARIRRFFVIFSRKKSPPFFDGDGLCHISGQPGCDSNSR